MADSAPNAATTDGCTAPERYPKLAPVIRYLDSLRGRADLGRLSELLNAVRITRADLSGCCQFGARGYKRNTISRSDWYELLALCWRSGDCTPIHDHKGVSCAFKVVEGTGTEIRFRPTPSGLICPCETNEMGAGYLCAAEDEDIHQVANMQGAGLDLITLHIYSPPISKMNTYKFAEAVSAECADRYAT